MRSSIANKLLGKKRVPFCADSPCDSSGGGVELSAACSRPRGPGSGLPGESGLPPYPNCKNANDDEDHGRWVNGCSYPVELTTCKVVYLVHWEAVDHGLCYGLDRGLDETSAVLLGDYKQPICKGTI